MRIIERFALEICGCESLWTAASIIEDAITTVKAKVGKDQVLLGLSGGVDSSVVAALLHRAVRHRSNRRRQRNRASMRLAPAQQRSLKFTA